MTDSADDRTRPIAVVDPDLMDLIPRYMEHRHEDVSAMRRAVAESDMDTIRVLAHRMRGSGGGYGFDGVTEIGGRIEDAVSAGDIATISAGIDDLTRYLDEVEVVSGE